MSLNVKLNSIAENILDAIAQLGIDVHGAFLDGSFRGGQCHVFRISFINENMKSLAVRLPLPMISTPADAVVYGLQMEVRILEFLEARGFIWSPRCRGHSLTFDNPVNHPFIVLTWVQGTALEWEESVPSWALKTKVLQQIAKIQVDLIECTVEHGSTTAMAYFTRLVNNKLARVADGKLPDLSQKDCLDQQALLESVLGAQANDNTFATEHGDLKPSNIIVDGECNIKGVIDWGFADQVPLLRAAGLPRFLWPKSFFIAPSETALTERQTYVTCITSLAAHTSHDIASCIRRLEASSDIDFLLLYLESLFSKGMHRDLARAGWQLRYRLEGS